MIGFIDDYTIEQCCEILDNLRVPLNSDQRFEIQGEYPYYGANGVQGFISNYVFDDDLILIAEDGGNFEQFATKPIAYRVKGKCWVNNHAHVLKAKKEFSQGFIFYSLEHRNILFFIAGGTRSKLTQGELRKITLKHPEKKEADKIGEIIGISDEAIAQTETLIAKYQSIKIGLMQDLLTRGIDTNGNIRSKATHKFVVKNGVEVPEEWEVKKASDLMFIINGGTPATSVKEFWESGIIPWLSVDDFNNGKRYVSFTLKHITNKGLENSATRLLPKNSIIISARGTVGVISQLSKEMAFNQSCYGLVSKNEKEISNDFLYYGLKQIFSKGGVAKSESVFDTITKNTFDEIKIAFPSTSKEFGRIIEILAQKDNFIEEQTIHLSKLYSLKTALMQDLLSGRVRVKVHNE
ncbi:MAG: restriction endonuclease subunit S [Nitrospirae bacterium]|nr:restriction endonuclease subunit S [Nitrospirota bacterium]